MAPQAASLVAALAAAALMHLPAAHALPAQQLLETRATAPQPFAPIDPQNWVNPDNMTWEDYVAPPSTSWSDPGRKGRSRNFNIAMVTVDYPGKPPETEEW